MPFSSSHYILLLFFISGRHQGGLLEKPHNQTPCLQIGPLQIILHNSARWSFKEQSLSCNSSSSSFPPSMNGSIKHSTVELLFTLQIKPKLLNMNYNILNNMAPCLPLQPRLSWLIPANFMLQLDWISFCSPIAETKPLEVLFRGNFSPPPHLANTYLFFHASLPLENLPQPFKSGSGTPPQGALQNSTGGKTISPQHRALESAASSVCIHSTL